MTGAATTDGGSRPLLAEARRAEIVSLLRDHGSVSIIELEAEVKRAMIAQSEQSVLLLDRTKLCARGRNAIVHTRELTTVLTHGVRPLELAPLEPPGLAVRMVDV